MPGVSAALKYLKSLEPKGMRLGLDRMRRHLALSGNPHHAFPSVHVAGTNGKGSVSAMLAAVLQSAGYKTGLYTSPHLFDFSERIQINGRPIPQKDLARILLGIQKKRFTLTHFETLTLAAFLYFAEQKVDVAVVETGLGGRLDATNTLERVLTSVITTISWDHMDRLGNSLRKIAWEKAGIIKPGVPVLSAVQEKGLQDVIRKEAEKAGAPLHFAGPKAVQKSGVHWKEGWQSFWSPSHGSLRLPLLGSYQRLNLALTLKTVDQLRLRGLDIPAKAVAQGLSRVNWPGRFQILKNPSGIPGSVILDGAHNAGGFEALTDALRQGPFRFRRHLFISGLLKDKDPQALARALAPVARRVIVTAPPSDRALSARSLARFLRRAVSSDAVEEAPDFKHAWARARAQARPGEAIVICGSLYLVGEALRFFKKSS